MRKNPGGLGCEGGLLLKFPRALIIFFIIIGVSFIVHELGHALFAVLLGSTIDGFEFGFLVFRVWISNYDPVFVPLIYFAGGFIQALFLWFIGPPILPAYIIEFKVIAVLFLIYGVIEAGSVI